MSAPPAGCYSFRPKFEPRHDLAVWHSKNRHFPPFLRRRRAGALARLFRCKSRLESRLRRFVSRRAGWGLHRGFKLWGQSGAKVVQTSADFAIRDRSRGGTGRDQSMERREHGGTKPSRQVATLGPRA